jgi:hypothetical protein
MVALILHEMAGQTSAAVAGNILEILGILCFASVVCSPLILYYIYHFKRCPSCKRGWALKTIGAKREGGGWFSHEVGAYEEKCEYCGYRQWVERDHNN